VTSLITLTNTKQFNHHPRSRKQTHAN